MIQIKNLSFNYEEQKVLKNISFDIEESSYIAIVGANGSGKTTLAKHLNALLLPHKGNIVVNDLNTKEDEQEVRKLVGFVFQNPEDQLIHSIVEEDIAFGLENSGVERNQIKKQVKEILKELSLEYLAKRNVNTLSAGQKQLVALAGVLVMNPKYIVFDEPATLLDPKNKKIVMNYIKYINQKKNIGIILVTNLLSDIKDAREIVVLKNGVLEFKGKKNRLTKNQLKKAGLDV